MGLTERQIQNRIARKSGEDFEALLETSFDFYRRRGYAVIEKTPEPMHPIKDLGGGKYVAVFRKKAQPDYKGVLKGGRTVMFEAKYTAADRIQQSRVNDDQSRYLDEYQQAGAWCYVIAGIGRAGIYCVPWDAWKEMKERFGRKYARPEDLEPYRVQRSRYGMLLILHSLKGAKT